MHVGDCLEVMSSLPADSFDSIVTDPPYGIRFMGKAWDGADIEARTERRRAMPSADPQATRNGAHGNAAIQAGTYDLTPKGMRAFQEFSADWGREAMRVLKPGGYCVAFASPRTFHRLVCGLEEAGFEIRDTPLPESTKTAAPAYPGYTMTFNADKVDTNVRTWQTRMAARGWTIGTDGIFGPETLRVVKAFQAEFSLGVDGEIGPITWRAAWDLPVS